jgi:hypothetical protein
MPGRNAPAGNEALVARHLRLGYTGLLVFLTLGVVLEALHGFKVGFYLDVGNEARRLSLRLTHAHGTLLSVLHVVFALTLGCRAAPPKSVAARAWRLLTAALLLLPGGFLLGGLFVHGGDPGVGVLLVPVGAGCLFVAVLLTARGIGNRGPTLREMTWGTPDYDASVVLRSHVLGARRSSPHRRPSD